MRILLGVPSVVAAVLSMPQLRGALLFQAVIGVILLLIGVAISRASNKPARAEDFSDMPVTNETKRSYPNLVVGGRVTSAGVRHRSSGRRCRNQIRAVGCGARDKAAMPELEQSPVFKVVERTSGTCDQAPQ